MVLNLEEEENWPPIAPSQHLTSAELRRSAECKKRATERAIERAREIDRASERGERERKDTDTDSFIPMGRIGAMSAMVPPRVTAAGALLPRK